MTTALIAEDEPLLAAEFCDELARLWPDLSIRAVVHDGAAALHALETVTPDVMFLDVQMPGKTGLEVARVAGTRAHTVFITAFDHYAVQAFDAGAVDYLLKPLEPVRLAETVRRLKARLVGPPADMSPLLARLAQHRPLEHLRYVTVLSGREIRFITVEEVCYFRADSKYVAVVTAEEEALISKPLKELVACLDRDMFWQIHRSLVVNFRAIKSVQRTLGGHLNLRLKERAETLRVGPSYAYQFRQM